MNEEDVQFEQKEKSERKLVIPGDLLGEGRASYGTYAKEGKIYSKFVGLAEERSGSHMVIQLNGAYMPKKGDGVVGRVEEIIFSKWLVDINSPYMAVMTLSEAVEEFVDLTKTDLNRYFDAGDLIFAEISAVSRNKEVNLSMKSRKCRKLRGGRLIKVIPFKVPRIIGRGGSMVEMIKNMTATQIVVGQNGIVWVRGDNEDLATKAILLIDEKSHMSGLTEYIKEFLEKSLKEMGKTVEQVSKESQESEEIVEEDSDDFEEFSEEQ